MLNIYTMIITLFKSHDNMLCRRIKKNINTVLHSHSDPFKYRNRSISDGHQFSFRRPICPMICRDKPSFSSGIFFIPCWKLACRVKPDWGMLIGLLIWLTTKCVCWASRRKLSGIHTAVAWPNPCAVMRCLFLGANAERCDASIKTMLARSSGA